MESLQELDLGNNDMSMSLNALTRLTGLKRLNLSSNFLDGETATALGSMPNLEHLCLADTGTRHGFVLPLHVVPAIKKCPNLVHLDISRMGMHAEHGGALDQLLLKLTRLQYLNIGGNRLAAAGLHEIADTLSDTRQLTTLDLSDNELGAWGTARLAAQLPDLQYLSSLRLAWNQVQNEGATHLASALHRFGALTELSLAGNDIRASGGEALAGALGSLSYLAALDLSANSFNPRIAQRIAEELSQSSSSSLTRLQLRYIGLHRIPAAMLSDLARCSALTELSLVGNSLETRILWDLQCMFGGVWTHERLQSLSDPERPKYKQMIEDREKCTVALSHSTSLIRLDLAACRLGPEGAAWVAKGVSGLSQLQRLKLGANRISDLGLSSLCLCIAGLVALVHLDLSGNLVGEQGVRDLASTLPQLQSLAHLDLGWNHVGDLGLVLISQALPACTRLGVLELSYNEISDEGVQSLAGRVGESRELGRLKLSGNFITMGGARALVLASRACRRLHEIDFRNNGLEQQTTSAGQTLFDLAEGLVRIHT